MFYVKRKIRRSTHLPFYVPPSGIKLIHQPPEPLIVTPLIQMCELMHDHIFQTFLWHLCQLDIETDPFFLDLTASPPCLHTAEPPFGYLLPNNGFIFLHQFRQYLPKLFLIPLIQLFPPFFYCRMGSDPHIDPTAPQFCHRLLQRTLYIQFIRHPPQIMDLSRFIFLLSCLFL